jgi:hypothetical protein
MITINFTGNINNDSLQVGDMVYYIPAADLSVVNNFNQSTVNPIFVGPIDVITEISIDVDETVGNPATNPNTGDFILFEKNSIINLSGLVGYYAEVTLKNNSTDKAELFSVASGITPSSK